MDSGDLGEQLRVADPATGLRAVGALHRLAEQVEATHVAEARRDRVTLVQARMFAPDNVHLQGTLHYLILSITV